MRKIIYILFVTAAIFMIGCGKKDSMTSFIPTATPTPEVELSDESGNGTTSDVDGAGEDATPTPYVIGETTTMYVKVNDYDAFLNVRSAPSVESDNKVGFLVHTEKVSVLEINGDWATILYNGQVCYVSASYLVEERPDYIAPPTATPSPTPTPEATATQAPTATPEPTATSKPTATPNPTVKPTKTPTPTVTPEE